MSGGCCYIEAEMVFDVQTGMSGDIEIRNQCV